MAIFDIVALFFFTGVVVDFLKSTCSNDLIAEGSRMNWNFLQTRESSRLGSSSHTA